MSNEPNEPITAPQAEGGEKPARRAPQCERFPGCIFFNDKMAKMPDTAEATKDQFCRGDFPKCARYIIQSIWKLKAPEDLYPYQFARMQAVLEAAVSEQRTVTPSSEELAIANRTIKLMVNALGHGFLMFDKTGICQPIYSKACESLLESKPAGQHISDVLHLDEKQASTMATALRLVFAGGHAMSFDEIMRFAPKLYRHSSGAFVKIEYKPDLLINGTVDRVIVIATDVTEQIHAQERDDERKALFERLERIFRDRAFFGAYVRRLNELLETLAHNGNDLSWDALRREVHTLKGDAGLFRLDAIASLLHDLENAFAPCVAEDPLAVPKSTDPCLGTFAPALEKIRQEVSALSTYLQNLLGMDITRIEAERSFDKKTLYGFAETLAAQGQPALREAYIQTVCAESLMGYMRRYDTVLRDLAARFNKKIKPIRFASGDVPVVIDLYRDVLETFVHLFRNIIDHGIETPEVRTEAGKAEEAAVEVRMDVRPSETGGQTLHLEIEDDGAGIAVEKLRQKLVAAFPNEGWSSRDDAAILEALLTSNISSRDTVTATSGRGVGVSTVNAKVVKHGGRMAIKTTPKKGTLVTIDLPYLLDVPKV